MSPQLLSALVAFCFVSSITPGPNNTMLMASGANFGFRPTLPHMLGVSLGFGFMVLAVGLGLGQVFVRFPILHPVLAFGGAIYMLWLAWKIAHASGLGEVGTTGSPMTFLQAAGFQWINPKAWIMGVTAVTTYAPQNSYGLNVVLVSLIFVVVNAPCIAAWAGFGVGLRGFLDRPERMRLFNISMAALLVLSLVPLIFEYAPALARG
ncbi:MAG: lysine transporter LysE [Alphaproteobacteria bacterium PA2]|nr:MAG: lysine transporter LysE [Alphaproteobacteria bacterium PA2]